MTTIHRVHNFSAGPAVMPLAVFEEIQRDLVALPGAGTVDPRDQPSVEALRGRSRRSPGGHPRAGRHSVELQSAVPPGWRQPSVLDGPDEPARARADGRLHRFRIVGDKAIKETKRVGTSERHGDYQGRGLLLGYPNNRS